MMGSNEQPQKPFVYAFDLDEVAPQNHLLRNIDRFLDLSDLRQHLAPYCSHTGRLAPDFKTIADFRKDNGTPIRLVCRNLDLFANAFVAIDGSKFKAVNNRDRNFTRAKMFRQVLLIRL
jgi:transposase